MQYKLHKKQIIIGSSLILVIGLIILTFWLGLRPFDEKRDTATAKRDVSVRHLPKDPAPVAAPATDQPATPATAPADSAPTTDPASTTPAAPAPSATETLHRSWLAQAGITDPYDAVNAVLTYSNWDVQYATNGNRGICAHVSPNIARTAFDPILQLQVCNRFILGAYGSWQGAADALARRAPEQ